MGALVRIEGHKKKSMTYGGYSGGVTLEDLTEAVAKADYGPQVEKLVQMEAQST